MRATAFLVAVLALSACGKTSVSSLPDVRLPTLGGPAGPSLAACATEKCLTVVVAPWCGICHQVTPDIVRLRRYLDKAGVSVRVVVGLSDLEQLKGMAKLYGSDTMLDADGAIAARGVPLFIVSDRGGKVLSRLNGYPRGVSTPEELAAAFDLP